MKNVSLSLQAATVWTLLNDVANVLCLKASIALEPLSLASPQKISGKNLSLANCGTTASHNNCTITVELQQSFNLLKFGLDLGLLTPTSGVIRTKCTIFGFVKIDCRYSLSGTESFIEGGNPAFISFENAPIEILATGEQICPTENYLDATFVSSSAIHILG